MVAQLDGATVRARPSRAVPRLLSYALFEGRPATTKGQWINPLVQRHLRAAARLDPGRRVDEPIFLVGIGRSGTTLLGRLLGVHPDVGFLNEPKVIWHELVDDEDIIGTYGAEPVRLHLGADDATPDRIARAHAVYGWYLRATRSSRVLDKYPELVYRAPFVRGLFPDSHIVAILREPWDVVTSIETWSATKGDETADWWGVDDRKWRVLWDQGVLGGKWGWLADHVDPARADQVTRAVVEWLLGTSAALALTEQVGKHDVHLVRYEALVDDPRRFLDDLFTACRLDPDPAVVALAETAVGRTREPAAAPAHLPDSVVRAADELAARVRAEV